MATLARDYGGELEQIEFLLRPRLGPNYRTLSRLNDRIGMEP